MFGKSIRLFKIFGFEVKLDLSWLILAFLITWTLAVGWFPAKYGDFSSATYWWMGIAGALGLFFSIVFHELAHSIIARNYGIPMRGITLFIFGGVAEMTDEPPNAKSEFMMAIAGPIASFSLSAIFYLIYFLFQDGILTPAVSGVLAYLSEINFILAVFNLVPAFPLDGGRVLRSLLWAWKKRLRWATRISSNIGSGFGVFLIALGVFAFLSGNFIGGVWWFLIGMFLFQASRMSYKQLLVRKALEGEPIQRFMHSEPVTVDSSLSVEKLVEDYFYKYPYKMFPVVENDTLVGCVNVQQIKELPRSEWSGEKVSDIKQACSEKNTVEPQTDAVVALSKMKNTGNEFFLFKS